MDRSERIKNRVKVATTNNERSRTKQEGRRDADVNTIVNTYKRTGIWANVNPRQPTWGDVSQKLELEVALELVNKANAEFMTLPAHVRALAQNSPTRLLEMLADPAQVEVLKAAGLPMKPTPAGSGDTTPEASGEGV